jgi:hypothetical protein
MGKQVIRNTNIVKSTITITMLGTDGAAGATVDANAAAATTTTITTTTKTTTTTTIYKSYSDSTNPKR